MTVSAVPTQSRSFAEVADALDKALVEIKAKKSVFDEASRAVQEASTAYQKSISDAQFLREELEKALNDNMGIPGSRVRVSG